MFPYLGGNGLAPYKPCAHELEGVSGVEAGARRAYGGPPVAAADEEPFARLCTRTVVMQDLAAVGVPDGCRACEMDRVSTASGSGDLLQPAGELGSMRTADDVLVGFGELTQARRAVEHGAPVSRGDVGGDGGDLPGWAAEAARMDDGWARSTSISCRRFLAG
jgi:hypothetical protein